MAEFKCPKCGGWAFGTRVTTNEDGSLNTDIVECHSWQDGTCSSNPFFLDEPGYREEQKRTRGFKQCKWSGPREEAICGEEEFMEMMNRRDDLREQLEAGE
jgi:hypothetical protein